jgi:hypothetical protein
MKARTCPPMSNFMQRHPVSRGATSSETSTACREGHSQQALEPRSEHDLPSVWMFIHTRRGRGGGGGGGGEHSTLVECWFSASTLPGPPTCPPVGGPASTPRARAGRDRNTSACGRRRQAVALAPVRVRARSMSHTSHGCCPGHTDTSPVIRLVRRKDG